MPSTVVKFLAETDADCPACGYQLRGAPEPRCPECSAPLHLEIATTQSRPGAWLFALLAWSLALGFDGVVAVIFTTAVAVTRPPLVQLYPYIWVALFLTLSALSAIGLRRVYAARTRWLARPVPVQRRDAILTFAAVALAHAAVGLTILLVG